MLKIFTRIGLAIVLCLAVVGIWSAQTHTPAFKDQSGQIIPGSIAEERWISLNGADHYLLLRGMDRTAPILLFLHGGPGTSAMPFNRVFNSELETHFLTVNWDQRGTGYSYKAGEDDKSLTLEQITSDLNELIEALCREFQQETVILVGHSWGSMLGLHYISEHPERVALYVGIGQMADTAESERLVYEWAYQVADARSDQKCLQVLEEIGAPPYASVDEMMRHRGVVNTLGGAWVTPMPDLRYASIAIKAPEFSWLGLRNTLRGADRSLPALFSTFTALKASEQYPRLGVPVVFFLGRGDRVVSPKSAVDYLSELDAPMKEVVWFEKSAHSPHWEEPARYMSELRRIVRLVGKPF
ncbi:MAG: alpha/beta hydrolase [Pseudomonadota bacterium]